MSLFRLLPAQDNGATDRYELIPQQTDDASNLPQKQHLRDDVARAISHTPDLLPR